MAFNAEQARKRAATGNGAAAMAQPPPGVPGPVPIGVPPLGVQNQGSTPEADQAAATSREERKRRRKSRWLGTEEDKTFIPGMPTMIPSGLNKDQEEAYLCK